MSHSALFHLFSMELRKLFSYRVTFWLRLVLGVVVQVTIAWFLWDAIFSYSQQETFGGMNLQEMQLYYLLVPLVSGLTMPEDKNMVSSEIYQGDLTKYLIYPINYFQVTYARILAVFTFGIMRFVAGIGIFALLFGIPESFHLEFENVILFLAVSLMACTLNFAIILCIEQAAFWVDVIWNLRVMLRFLIMLLGGAMLPLTLFPKTAQIILEYLPFQNLYWLPIKLLMGPINYPSLFVSCSVLIGWALFFLLLAKKIWSRGQYQYTGVGI